MGSLLGFGRSLASHILRIEASTSGTSKGWPLWQSLAAMSLRAFTTLS